jgi:hypothetical protein
MQSTVDFTILNGKFLVRGPRFAASHCCAPPISPEHARKDLASDVSGRGNGGACLVGAHSKLGRRFTQQSGTSPDLFGSVDSLPHTPFRNFGSPATCTDRVCHLYGHAVIRPSEASVLIATHGRGTIHFLKALWPSGFAL